MSRWIDADELIADMRERYCKPCQERKEDCNGVRCRACWVDDAMDDVDGFGDNGINIVRCKECKCFNHFEDKEHGEWNTCERHMIFMNPDDFCSYGEREGE